MARVIEIYAGAYASGKSETALNRARQYAQLNKPITLVDLDTVEPAYTLRPIANDLSKMGINVITQPDNFGLGEAASYVTPAQVNFLSNDGDIIVDVGYGAGGLDILDIVIIGGLHHNTLGVIRSLGEAGIRPEKLNVLIKVGLVISRFSFMAFTISSKLSLLYWKVYIL